MKNVRTSANGTTTQVAVKLSDVLVHGGMCATKTDQLAGDHNHRHLRHAFVVWRQR